MVRRCLRALVLIGSLLAAAFSLALQDRPRFLVFSLATGS